MAAAHARRPPRNAIGISSWKPHLARVAAAPLGTSGRSPTWQAAAPLGTSGRSPRTAAATRRHCQLQQRTHGRPTWLHGCGWAAARLQGRQASSLPSQRKHPTGRHESQSPPAQAQHRKGNRAYPTTTLLLLLRSSSPSPPPVTVTCGGVLNTGVCRASPATFPLQAAGSLGSLLQLGKLCKLPPWWRLGGALVARWWRLAGCQPQLIASGLHAAAGLTQLSPLASCSLLACRSLQTTLQAPGCGTHSRC